MQRIPYHLVRSDRKTLAVQISPEGEVIVRAPKRMPAAVIEQFLESKRGWIEKHLSKRSEPMPKLTDEEIHTLAQQALEVIPERAAYYAKQIGVTYGRITVRNQRTRWGSCSAKGNLNFNCLLMLAPDEVINYVVVHELCHRKEMNHSPRFWAEVERILPDYKIRRRWLKEHGNTLIGRLN